METDEIGQLFKAYKLAPHHYQATSYWDSYEGRVLAAVRSLDINQLRSGKYPILATFGMGDDIYLYHPNMLRLKKYLLKLARRHVGDRAVLPYGLNVSNIQEMAYRHCELMGRLTDSIPISSVQVSMFGNPNGVFEMHGNNYTVQFLAYYIRYCFANKYIKFNGDEIIVELGSGSGYQVELLKKLYPNTTILCFDLPAQIYICGKYLSHALEHVNVIGPNETLAWNNMSRIERGGVYLFGNWKFPLLRNSNFDIFWNAASFGEMEPDVVKNYLNGIEAIPEWIYLLQARNGKETRGKAHVSSPIRVDDYSRFLSGYSLLEEHDAWQAHRRLSETGGYFEGIWKKRSAETDA